jgi:hypothetical protein
MYNLAKTQWLNRPQTRLLGRWHQSLCGRSTGNTQGIGLKLHQKVILTGAAINFE